MRIEILTFSLKICFQNHFFSLGSGQTKKCKSKYLRFFKFDHLPRSKMYSKSLFGMRLYIFIFNFFFKWFWSIFQELKKNYHCIFKN